MSCHGDVCFHDGVITLQLVSTLREGGGGPRQPEAHTDDPILQHALEVPLDPLVGQTCMGTPHGTY